MPEPINNLSSMTIINPTVSYDGVPRFSNPPPVQQSYQNWNQIEDVYTCQTAIPYGTQSPYSMNEYNSNFTIPNVHQAVCPNAGTQYIMNAQYQAQNRDPFLPHTTSVYDAVAFYNHNQPSYTSVNPYPPYAGSIPNMQNAVLTDGTVPINPTQNFPQSIYVEGYAAPNPNDSQTTLPTPTVSTSNQTQSLQVQKHVETLEHMKNCELCRQLTRCPTTKYWVAIGVLIVIILLLLFYIFIKNKPRPQMIKNTLY